MIRWLLLAGAVTAANGAVASSIIGTCEVRTGPELAAAFTNESCTVAVIVVPRLELLDQDWLGIDTPVLMRRTFTIRGSSSLGVIPLFRPTARRKVQMLDGGSITIQYLIMKEMRRENMLRAPGADLLLASPIGSTNATVTNLGTYIMAPCFPEELMDQNLQAVPRLYGVPGRQRYILQGPNAQPGCVNSTDAPYIDRCWPLRVVAHDLQTPGLDIDTGGFPVPNNYNVVMFNLTCLCSAVMTQECMTRLGPIGCLLFYDSGGYNETSPTSPPPPLLLQPPPLGSPVGAVIAREEEVGKGRTSLVPVLVGSIVGGAMLAACVGLVAAALSVHRKRRQLASRQTDDGKPVATAVLVLSSDVRKVDAGANGHHNMLPPEAAPTATVEIAVEGTPPPKDLEDSGDRPSQLDSAAVVTARTRVHGVQFNVQISDTGEQDPAVHADGAASTTAGDPRSRADSQLPEERSVEVVRLLPEVLGKGAFGMVYVGLHGGQRVAVKMVDRAFEAISGLSMTATTSSLKAASSRPNATLTGQTFAQELEVMGRCQHPNIVRILAACVKPPRPFLVMELMDTALDKLMYAEGATLLPMHLVIHIATEIARGLAYLHPTIIHRDLKPGNVLINDPWGRRPVVKISDFGLSRFHHSVLVTQSPEAGTPAYVAPECFDVNNFTICFRADTYSFGVLLWEMLAGKRPWEGLGAIPIAFQIALKGRRLPVPSTEQPGNHLDRWPPQLCAMLHECWDQDPSRRPAAAELAKRLTLLNQKHQADSGEPLAGS